MLKRHNMRIYKTKKKKIEIKSMESWKDIFIDSKSNIIQKDI